MLGLVALGKNYSVQEHSFPREVQLKTRVSRYCNRPRGIAHAHCTIKGVFCSENALHLGNACPGPHKVYYIYFMNYQRAFYIFKDYPFLFSFLTVVHTFVSL